MSALLWIGLVLALGMGLYLIVALLLAERFQ